MNTLPVCAALPLSPATLRSPTTLLSVALVVWLAGCGSDPAGPGPTLGSGDAGTDGAAADVVSQDSASPADSGAATDATASDGSGGVVLGEPCSAHTDCVSGLCGWGRFGQLCVSACATNDDCASGICAPLDPTHKATDADVKLGCLDRHVDLCRPCVANDDCAGIAQCVPTTDGSGSYCESPCDPKASQGEANTCPKGFACETAQDAEGKVTGSWCAPIAGECLCSPRAVHAKAHTTCSTTNDAGTCSGERACGAEGLSLCDSGTPFVETCDGVDTDCDGETDEDIAPQPCEAKNPNGSCGGVQTCKDAKLVCDALAPGEEACDGLDNDCDGHTDEGFVDTDGDKVANCVDSDDDGDKVADKGDNCPLLANPDQADVDNDGDGDACDPDDDNDGVKDGSDNCPLNANGGQLDTDKDGKGDACDPDDDGDGVNDAADVCPLIPNKDQTDTDKDGQGDACDSDDDGDGTDDAQDNCPLVANPKQVDTDNDKKGDVCDDDDDGDGVADKADNCQLIANPKQLNTDQDAFGDACDDDDDGDGVIDTSDNCPLLSNPKQLNSDKDKLGDACDDDDDDDGVFDLSDNCTLTANPDQADNDKATDKSVAGDACDDDDDNDGVFDLSDNCTLTANPDQADNDKATDKSVAGDACDDDDDNDNVPDKLDNCPLLANAGQADLDKDGKGDLCDDDDDGDGVPDAKDNCKTVKNGGQLDTDKDGKGNACDDDDDGDGAPDGKDCKPLDKTVFPKAKESCNGKDDDCDGSTDESGAAGCTVYYADYDQDGYGVSTDKDCRCKPGYPYVAKATPKWDCAPNVKAIHPGATEVCDTKDNNCDGKKDNVEGGCALGSKNKPAARCLDIHNADKKAADGLYWLSPSGNAAAAKQHYCLISSGGWTRVVIENGAVAAGWSDPKITNGKVGGTATKIHGLWGKGGKSTKTFGLLGFKHTQIKVGGRYYAVDSWDDEHEGAQVWLAGKKAWTAKKKGGKPKGGGWTSVTVEPNNWGKNMTHGYWSLWGVVPAQNHNTNSVVVTFATGLDQGVNDEAFGFSHVSFWVK